MNPFVTGWKSCLGAVVIAAGASSAAYGSSHMDAPLITFDDPANTTDVYAFLSESNGEPYLTTALSVYPFEEPGIGPNNYRFDDRVRYELHVALGQDSIAAGESTLTYRFEFATEVQDQNTIRQAYLGPVDAVLDADGFFINQNLRQSYVVTRIDNRSGAEVVLGDGIVPPNNQGQVTPFYNQEDDGDMPAKEGVSDTFELDPYTEQSIAEMDFGYQAFAGQRDDGFYADIQSIFDLDFSFGRNDDTPSKPFDSQGGFNLHTLVLNIPMSELEGVQIAGVFATTSRPVASGGQGSKERGNARGRNAEETVFVQVGRQGNPLFVEALVAGIDKDAYNQSLPSEDARFAIYAEDPIAGPDGTPIGNTGIEISRLLNVLPPIPGLVASIYIPDMIKVDLTTGPARTPNDPDFHRLGFFGGDVLQSQFQDPFGNGGLIPGGWPNGRRFGDDVLDIALLAVGAEAPEPVDPAVGPDYDRVVENDITYNDVFPYAATPLNGRNHGHHGEVSGDL